MAKQAKVSYDSENDILWVATGEKIKDSLEIDKFVLDISPDNRVVGVEIMDASKIINKLVPAKVTKEMLGTIRTATLSFYPSKEVFFVTVSLSFQNRKDVIPIQISAPKAAMPQLA